MRHTPLFSQMNMCTCTCAPEPSRIPREVPHWGPGGHGITKARDTPPPPDCCTAWPRLSCAGSRGRGSACPSAPLTHIRSRSASRPTMGPRGGSLSGSLTASELSWAHPSFCCPVCVSHVYPRLTTSPPPLPWKLLFILFFPLSPESSLILVFLTSQPWLQPPDTLYLLMHQSCLPGPPIWPQNPQALPPLVKLGPR